MPINPTKLLIIFVTAATILTFTKASFLKDKSHQKFDTEALNSNLLHTKGIFPFNKDVSKNQCSTSYFYELFADKQDRFTISEHEVTTDDGYILKLFKVSLSEDEKLSKNIQNQDKAIFLQHGIVDSADGWFVYEESKSIGFHLANKGFEIWVGNSRGNKYSHTHVIKDIDWSEYFSFSFDEMGQYDIPAFYNYILKNSKAEKIVYIGHSQGTAQMFAALTDPTNQPNAHYIANHTDKFIALSPVVHMGRSTSPLLVFLSTRYTPINYLAKKIGYEDVVPSFCSGETYWKKQLQQICNFDETLCHGIPFIHPDRETDGFLDNIPYTLSHYPSGISRQALIHLVQLVNQGIGKSVKFQKFDYGSAAENLVNYQSETPPIYDIGMMNNYGDLKVVLMAGGKDDLADAMDVEDLFNKLNPKNTSMHLLDKYNHITWFMPKDPSMFFKIIDEELGL